MRHRPTQQGTRDDLSLSNMERVRRIAASARNFLWSRCSARIRPAVGSRARIKSRTASVSSGRRRIDTSIAAAFGASCANTPCSRAAMLPPPTATGISRSIPTELRRGASSEAFVDTSRAAKEAPFGYGQATCFLPREKTATAGERITCAKRAENRATVQVCGLCDAIAS